MEPMSGSTSNDEGDIVLDPQPGFVVKTLIGSGKRQGKKVFINICSDTRMPEPEDGYGMVIIERVEAGDDYIIPIVLSSERQTTDKQGRESYVWDCCMHPRVIVESIKLEAMKVLVIETCLELVEDRSGMVLSREYSTPKMVQKGQFERTVIRKRDFAPSQGGEKFGVTQSMDQFAKQVLEPPAEETNQDQAAAGNQRGRPLIQVLASTTTPEPELLEEETESKMTSYKIVPFQSETPQEDADVSPSNDAARRLPRPCPRYAVKVQIEEKDNSSKPQHVFLSKCGKKILFNGDSINLPCESTSIEAFYVSSDHCMHIFVY